MAWIMMQWYPMGKGEREREKGEGGGGGGESGIAWKSQMDKYCTKIMGIFEKTPGASSFVILISASAMDPIHRRVCVLPGRREDIFMCVCGGGGGSFSKRLLLH